MGYMDPGNWGTDLLGGSKFGYSLLWVILASNFVAQFLQILCVRLGVVTGKDLAQMCHDQYSKRASIALWILAEVAIIACDLAEVVGSAVALQLLFGMPLILGVVVTGVDVLLLLGLQKFGFRKVEALVTTLIVTIFACFAYEIFLSHPDWSATAKGLMIPTVPNGSVIVILGIIGATVMPHNLYLHSSLVQTRLKEDKAEAIRYNVLDTVVALSFAFLVNAAILMVASAVFHSSGRVVEELAQGHELLKASLGGASAVVFAIALLASGQSSTITGTLAGQIVMEGFTTLRIPNWQRRLLTRGLAIVPAISIIAVSGGKHTVDVLLVSQVILSLQLPFAIFPLLKFTSNAKHMGKWANAKWIKAAGYAMGLVISALNIYLLASLL